MGACMLVRREAVEEVGPLDERSSSSARRPTGATASARPAGRCCFFPGAECVHVGGALARRAHVPRERARAPALPRQAPRRPRTPSARGGCSAGRCGCAALVFRGERGRMYRDAAALARIGPGAGAARPMTLLRLALATGVLLLPGAVVARALGLRGASATLAWALALIFGALAVTFVVGGVAEADARAAAREPGVVALRVRPARSAGPSGSPGRWWVARRAARCSASCSGTSPGEIGGDGLFHLARVRKLEAFDSLSLDAVNEFADGGLHPGYAFPLWHGFLALVAARRLPRPGRRRPARGLGARAARVARRLRGGATRSSARVGPAVAVVCAQVARDRARAGARRRLHRARAAGDRVAAAARAGRARARVRRTSSGRRAACSPRPPPAGSSWPSSTRPTRSSSGSRSRASSSSARSSRRDEARRIATALAALVVPAAAFLAWLAARRRGTRPRTRPTRTSCSARFEQYAGQLDVFSGRRATAWRRRSSGARARWRSPRSCFVPLAGLALRRRWAAYVLGGFARRAGGDARAAAVRRRSPTSSRSRSRAARPASGRFAFAFAGGLDGARGAPALARCCRSRSWRGIALQLAYPGDFDYRLEHGGPALVTWFAVVGGVVAARRRARAAGAHAVERPTSSSASPRRSSCSRRRARGLELEPVGRAPPEPADAGARRGAARGRAGGRRRLLRPRDELPDRGRRRPSTSPPRRRATSPTPRRTGPTSGARRTRVLRAPATSRSPRRAGATWLVVDRSRFELAARRTVSTATGASRSTGSRRRR